MYYMYVYVMLFVDIPLIIKMDSAQSGTVV